MTCNLCDAAACECGAEAAQMLWLTSHGFRCGAWSNLSCTCRPAKWPELEAMEAALDNYGKAA